MIPYERTRQQTIPNSAVKIIGVGGAGANMLDRIALDGMEGAELLACNTDARTLTSSVAPEKIQLGRNLTKGLGSGVIQRLGTRRHRRRNWKFGMHCATARLSSSASDWEEAPVLVQLPW